MLPGVKTADRMAGSTTVIAVMAVVPPAERPAAASVTAVPRSLAQAAPPLLSGYLLGLSSFGWPLVIGGALKGIYDLLLLVIRRNFFVNFAREIQGFVNVAPLGVICTLADWEVLLLHPFQNALSLGGIVVAGFHLFDEADTEE